MPPMPADIAHLRAVADAELLRRLPTPVWKVPDPQRPYLTWLSSSHVDDMEEAATRIEALLARLETAERERDSMRETGYAILKSAAEDEAKIQALTARAEKAEAALSEARALLMPFALEANEWADSVPDRYRPHVTEPGKMTVNPGAVSKFTVGHIRAAREFMERTKP